ncbi:MAG: LamG domain-containing protein, partial [Planctomycetota bacterium]
VIHPDSPWRGDIWSFSILPEISITDPSPVGWWKFDDGSGNTAIDSSGNGFDITLHNATWEDGVFGGAVHFHGEGSGGVENFRLSDNAITVCAWVRHDAFRIGEIERYVTAHPAVIRKDWEHYNGRYHRTLHFYIITDGNHRHLWVGDVLTEGLWHHVAGTWDGVTQRLYIDSVEIASQVPGGVLGDTSRVVISSGDEPLNGMLDDVRIYNKALSAFEVSNLAGDQVSPIGVIELTDALDTDLSFTTGGSADWFSQTRRWYEDGDAAQSGEITHDQESWLQTTVSGAGRMSFYWKVSSENNCDYLEFYIDGARQDRISGSEDWHKMTYEITGSALHTLEWLYVKDGSWDSGSDCGCVDKMEWVSN